MSSSQKVEFPFESEEEYELILGESFLSNRTSTGFHTIRCKIFHVIYNLVWFYHPDYQILYHRRFLHNLLESYR